MTGERRTAIVTGSDSGIGRATAISLAHAGFDVGITWHSDKGGAEHTAQLVRDADRTAHITRLDLADLPTVGDRIDGLAEQLGRLDVLVNSAAIDPRAAVVDETIDAWRLVLDVNLTGPFISAQIAIARMVGQGEGGRIVNVTSIHEHLPLRHGAGYAATKAALGMLTKVMALELAPKAITVNAVAPGHIATPMNGFHHDEEPLGAPASIPLGRVGTAAEVAGTIVHLCSPAAGYITGSSFIVDGGLSLMAVLPLQDELEPQR